MSRTNPPLRTLREHPDLNQLRRQAKELLAAFRDGEPDAVAEVSHHYRGANPAAFALHDAQLVLARAYGFESWPKLKAVVDGATVSRLIEAVRAGDTARVRTILDARPEIVNMDVLDTDEHRALHYAVLMRSVEMVRVLMEHGADPRIGIYPHRIPTTALAIATERGYEEIVAVIREVEQKRTGAPAAPPPADRSEVPPPRALLEAVERGDARAAIAFLESSSELRNHPNGINWYGPGRITLLHVACARVMVELVAWLLEHGADVHPRNSVGFMPIDMLGRWPIGHPHDGVVEVANLLLRHGAERTAFWAIATNNLEWLRARHAEGKLENRVVEAAGGLVTFAVRLDRPEALTLLLDLGFDPNERPDPGKSEGTPLEWCAGERRFALADILLQRGATLTPTLAVALGKSDWVRARHAEGTLDHPKDGDGLLTVAVKHDRADMLQLLLDLGLDIDERRRTVGREGIEESRGNPLDRAAERGSIAMAQMLLERGADPNAGAVATAYSRHDRAMLDLLEKYDGHVSAATAAYHRDVPLARQRIREEDAGQLPTGAVSPGRTVAEELLAEFGEPEIVRMALERIDWLPDDSRWHWTLKGPLSFWSHVPWIEKPDWKRSRDGYLVSFRMILARCHANVKGSFGRTILHDVMAMGFHDGVSGWVKEEEALAFAVTLLDAGARTDVRDELLKSTPLGWACRWGRTLIVEEMLRRGVDAIEPDAEPWATPRAWAEKMDHREIVAMFDQR